MRCGDRMGDVEIGREQSLGRGEHGDQVVGDGLPLVGYIVAIGSMKLAAAGLRAGVAVAVMLGFGCLSSGCVTLAAAVRGGLLRRAGVRLLAAGAIGRDIRAAQAPRGERKNQRGRGGDDDCAAKRR